MQKKKRKKEEKSSKESPKHLIKTGSSAERVPVPDAAIDTVGRQRR